MSTPLPPKPPSNQAFKAFVDASAGAMGALFAAVLLYPLDVVKTRQQVAKGNGADNASDDDSQQLSERHPHHHAKPSNMWALCWAIYRSEGAEGLFAGLSSKMAHTVFSSFAYFYWYSFLKQATERRTGQTITTGMNLVVAAVAGALNMSMTLPLEMINTRMQITDSNSSSDEEEGDNSDGLKPTTAATEGVHHKGMWETTKEIYAEDGLLSFWKGYIPSLVLVSNPSINYTVFDKLKLRMQQWKQQQLNAKRLVALTMFEAFVLAAIAKAIATIITYPVIRAKVLMQAQKKQLEDKEGDHHHHKPKDYGNSMMEVLQTIGQREGLSGYFRGCSAQLFNTVLKSALLLMTKEQIYTFTMRILYALRRHNAPAIAAKA